MDSDGVLKRAIAYALKEVERIGDPAKLPEAVRTVVLVHAAQGIINNGGLQYFFESDFPGQPNYSILVAAYDAIGATAEARVLEAAIASFPFSDPHKFRARREEVMERYAEGEIDPFYRYTKLLCGNKNVWRCLGRYVREHRDQFVL